MCVLIDIGKASYSVGNPVPRGVHLGMAKTGMEFTSNEDSGDYSAQEQALRTL